MVYRGHIKDGRVELNDPINLPEGAEVELTVVSPGTSSSDDRPIEEIAEEIFAEVPSQEWERLPADLSDQLDHYIYGTPKK